MCRQHFFVVATFFTNGRNKEGSIYYFNKASKSTCVNHNTVPSLWLAKNQAEITAFFDPL